MNRRICRRFALALALVTAGCGNSSHSSNNNGGGGNTAITVAVSTAPPASIQTGLTATIAATVANDSANKGVAWSCAPLNACGSFNPTQTASGAMTTYSAPASAPQGGSVTITATSVADPTKSVAVTVQIASPAAIAVTLSTAPPASLQTGATAAIAATVANDSANKGVTWSCAPANACGSFNPLQTASAASTTYTAPSTTPPPNTQQGFAVTLTATSVSDSTKSATATVVITSASQAIAIQLTTVPASESVQTGATAAFAATVSNDSTNAGVTWSCTPSNACGSFNPALTASAAATTYTAPASVPQSNLIVVTATSVADNTKSASALLTVYQAGTQNSLLNGQYSFLLTGLDSPGSYAIAGSVTLDGSGNVSGGELDVVDAVPANAQLGVPVSGTYAIDATNHGTMTLNYTFNNVAYFVNFSFVATSGSHAVIVETDGGASASGSLDLQSAGPSFSLSQIAGNYSFTLSGEDILQLTPQVEGGIFSLNSSGTITNGTIDSNDNGTIATGAFQATATAPDSHGRGTVTSNGGSTFVYYVVTPEVLRVIETDANTIAGGSAFGQGNVSSYTNASLTGRFAFHDEGQDASYGQRVAAGEFTTDGNGNVTGGDEDTNAGGSTSYTVDLTGVTYSISGSPRGTLTFFGGAAFNLYLTDPTLNLLDPNNTTGGGGALLLEADSQAFRTGAVLPQAQPTGANVQGNYAMNLVNLNGVTYGAFQNQSDNNLVGQVSTNSSGYQGLVDYSMSGNYPVIGDAAAGSTLTVDPTYPGRFTGTLTITPPANAFVFAQDNGSGTGQINVTYYQITTSEWLVVGTSPFEVVYGVLQQ